MKQRDKDITLLDSMQVAIAYADENLEVYSDYIDELIESINDMLESYAQSFETRYKTVVAAYSFIGDRSSWYGDIGGNGFPVGVSTINLDVTECLEGCDDFRLIFTKDNTLALEKTDHDGTNYMELRFVTQSEFLHYYLFEYDYFNLAEYIFRKGKTPTKLNQKYLEAIIT